MIQSIVIIGLMAAFWTLILHRKRGPYQCFLRLRRLIERIPGLRSILGEVSGCETCCCFWLSLLLASLFTDMVILDTYQIGIVASASAGFAIWLLPTMAVQVGAKEHE